MTHVKCNSIDFSKLLQSHQANSNLNQFSYTLKEQLITRNNDTLMIDFNSYYEGSSIFPLEQIIPLLLFSNIQLLSISQQNMDFLFILFLFSFIMTFFTDYNYS